LSVDKYNINPVSLKNAIVSSKNKGYPKPNSNANFKQKSKNIPPTVGKKVKEQRFKQNLDTANV